MRGLVNGEGNDEDRELDEDAAEIDAQQGMSAYHGILPGSAKDPPHAGAAGVRRTAEIGVSSRD
jgi:hypothetical protein